MRAPIFTFTLAAVAQAGLLSIDSRTQLFTDNYLLESLTNVRRVMNTAEKAEHNPVVRPDRPWEGKETRVSYVIFDEKDQIFKMWYSSPTRSEERRVGEECRS